MRTTVSELVKREVPFFEDGFFDDPSKYLNIYTTEQSLALSDYIFGCQDMLKVYLKLKETVPGSDSSFTLHQITNPTPEQAKLLAEYNAIHDIIFLYERHGVKLDANVFEEILKHRSSSAV